MRLKKIILIALSALFAVGTFGGCDTVDKNDEKPEDVTFTATFFTDVHHGDNNYNDFKCTNARKKLRAILNETTESDCYFNLGDFVDYLKGGANTFYDEAAAVLTDEFGLAIYTPGTDSGDKKLVYNSMGNHEAAFVPKSQLSEYIPYVEDVGSAYVFERDGVLFVQSDANYDRSTGSDAPSTLKTSTKFVLPQAEIDYLKQAVSHAMNDRIKSIVWVSHIAFKDIENTSRWALADELIGYDRPVTLFEGHTHTESHNVWYDEYDDSKVILDIYTLPAVTSGEGYRYYNVTFKNGVIDRIDKHTDGVIELE